MGSGGAPAIAVFGASGVIGGAICQWHLGRGRRVLAISRSPAPGAPNEDGLRRMQWDQSTPDAGWEGVEPGDIDAVVWAQGANANDSIKSFDLATHERLYAANVSYVLVSLSAMLRRGLVPTGARLCVISSIWQQVARQNKLSYMVSKSALHGLVQSLAIDLGQDGILVNAVLPGALDTPMTRANLSTEQIARLEKMTPLGALPELEDVCGLVGFLCSPANSGITGQFIASDKGFSYAKII